MNSHPKGNWTDCSLSLDDSQVVDLGPDTVTHFFLVMPDCSCSLIWGYLLQSLWTTLSFGGGHSPLSLNCTKPPTHILMICPLLEE